MTGARFRFWRGEHGNLAIVLPMIVATAVGGAALWGYNNIMQNLGAGSRASIDNQTIGRNVFNRILTVLTVPGSSALPGVGTNGCGDTATAGTINSQLREFRNLADLAPNLLGPPKIPVTYTYTNGVGGSLANTCLLPDFELANASLQSVTVNVALVTGTAGQRADDLVNFTRLVQVSVRVQSLPTAEESVKILTLSGTIRLKVASLGGDYGLVLYDSSPTGLAAGTPWISVVNTASVRVVSPTYIANPTNGVTAFNSFTDNPSRISLEGQVDMRGVGFSLGALTDIDLSLYRALFAGGVRSAVFDDSAVADVLPIEDPGVAAGVGAFAAMAGSRSAWQQVVSYSVNAAEVLPYPNVLLTPEAGPLSGPPDANAALLLTAATPPAAVLTPTPSVWPAATLSTSCSGTWRTRPGFVFNRDDQSVTLSLNSTNQSYVICGFVNAQNVNIVLAGGGTQYFLGVIFANHLNITGTGTLIIANPLAGETGLDEFTVLGNIANGPGKFSYLVEQMREQRNLGPARNFFVPIMRHRAPVTISAARFRPGGTISTLLTTGAWVPGIYWAGQAGAPQNANDTPTNGKMSYIAASPMNSYAYTSTGVITNRPPIPDPTSGLAQTNLNDLFPAGVYHDELVFTAKEVKP